MNKEEVLFIGLLPQTILQIGLCLEQTLISPTAVAQHLQEKYRFMHIGLVQVVVKPLLRNGVNAPIYLALRDKRLRHYKSSSLAVIQTNVCKGPIFFNLLSKFYG